jgi:phospholipid-binding lipoprotein MlaA
MRLLSSLLILLALAGCASTGRNPADPWEPMNRKIFAFNDAVDKAVAKPIAQGYQKVMPSFAQEGVMNFYSNLEDINNTIQNLLQGKPAQSASDAARFVVNSVLGIFGLWDVATPMGLEKHDEDFGQTLGVWGVPSGPYFVIPLLGPSSLRDAPARIVDPQWYYAIAIGDNWKYWTWWGVDKVRTRASLLTAESVLEKAALDKYNFIRDAWIQRRQSQVYDGNPPRPKEDDE